MTGRSMSPAAPVGVLPAALCPSCEVCMARTHIEGVGPAWLCLTCGSVFAAPPAQQRIKQKQQQQRLRRKGR